MGCLRRGLIEKPGVIVNAAPQDICEIPKEALEGQMTFVNHGATTIYLRLGQTRGSKECNAAQFTLIIPAGNGFSEEGIVPGVVIAFSSAPGGILTSYVSYR